MLEFTIGQVIEFIMYANTMLARRRDELDIAPGSPLQSKRSPGIYHANPNPASKQARSRGKNTNTIHAKTKHYIRSQTTMRAVMIKPCRERGFDPPHLQCFRKNNY